MRLSRALVLGCVLAGCAPAYTGASRELSPDSFRTEGGWIAVDGVPLQRQQGEHDCGGAALSMVLAYWKPAWPREEFAGRDERLSAGALRDRARARGFAAFVLPGRLEDLEHELSRGRPVIAGTVKPTASGGVAHYEVVIGLHPRSRRVATLDPALGFRQHSLRGFLAEWTPSGRLMIVIAPQQAAEKPAAEPFSLGTGPTGSR